MSTSRSLARSTPKSGLCCDQRRESWKYTRQRRAPSKYSITQSSRSITSKGS
ncbi:hypothetical protein DPMN_137408 [Dreissena polymorpha]|uniref:Uncharacterized protein n=1 Tax=Dreissena polymorpha TaxID=45954 RepID=A0A9D4JEP0_DREPO|nr:hypothetical protein DPMN_137408 [Dreissena polymorpha]